MVESSLSRLTGAALRGRGDPDAWLELARAAGRGGRHPEGLSAETHLPGLLELWGRHPDERALAMLVMPLLGLEAAQPIGPLGSFWEDGDRLGQEPLPYDRSSGLPLAVRGGPGGLRYRLVPGHGEGAPLYVATRLLTVREVDRVVGEETPDFWQLQQEDPDRPALELSWEQAVLVAGRMGARLPTEAEWERAAGGFGLEGLPGEIREWCADWYPEQDQPGWAPAGRPDRIFRSVRGAGPAPASPGMQRIRRWGHPQHEGAEDIGVRVLREVGRDS